MLLVDPQDRLLQFVCNMFYIILLPVVVVVAVVVVFSADTVVFVSDD
jgi:hypothetical protein